MKKSFIFFISLFTLTLSWGQVDKNGNPIFNSIELSEENFGDFELTTSYYTIENNINNPESSVYINNTPSINDYLTFSRNLPSYFFIIHKGSNVLALILLMQKNEEEKTFLSYHLTNPNTGKHSEIPCKVWGEISEKRADELLKLRVDSNSKIIELPNNGKGILYDGLAYRIQPYEKMKEEVIQISKQLISKIPEKIDTIYQYIRLESIDGKLDFIKTLDPRAVYIYNGIAYTINNYAILLWGQAVKKLGIQSAKYAALLWEDIYKRKLTSTELKALKKGFSAKI